MQYDLSKWMSGGSPILWPHGRMSYSICILFSKLATERKFYNSEQTSEFLEKSNGAIAALRNDLFETTNAKLSPMWEKAAKVSDTVAQSVYMVALFKSDQLLIF